MGFPPPSPRLPAPVPAPPAPLPAYRAQLGPHGGAAPCSLRRRRESRAAAPRPRPPAASPSEEGRGRAGPGGPAPHAARERGDRGVPRTARGPRQPPASVGSHASARLDSGPRGILGWHAGLLSGPFVTREGEGGAPARCDPEHKIRKPPGHAWPQLRRGHLAGCWASQAFPVLTLLSSSPLQAFELAAPALRDTVPSCLRASLGSLVGCRSNVPSSARPAPPCPAPVGFLAFCPELQPSHGVPSGMIGHQARRIPADCGLPEGKTFFFF